MRARGADPAAIQRLEATLARHERELPQCIVEVIGEKRRRTGR
jgi:hypothetical protein